MDRIGAIYRGICTGLAAFALGLLSSIAALADWSSRNLDQPEFGVFSGYAASDPAYVSLSCGDRMPGRTPTVPEYRQTAPYTLYLGIAPEALSLPGTTDRRDDAAIWVNGTGYRLPVLVWDDPVRFWATPIAMTDPLINAMRQGRDIIVGPLNGRQFQLDSNGMAAAVEATMAFCAERFRQLGHAVPAALSNVFGEGTAVPSDFLPGAANAQAGMAEQARADALRLEECNPANVSLGDRALAIGDIDGDGLDDAVLDWRGVNCSTQRFQTFCGASHCRVSVYISSSYSRTRAAFELMGIGANTVPLSNGLLGVGVGGGLADCNSAGKGQNGCTFVYYWNGSDLVLIP